MLSLIIFTQEAYLTFVFSSSLISCSVFLSFVRKYGLLWVLFWPYRALRKWVDAYLFIFNAPQQIQKAYDTAQGATFHVDGPDIHYYLVSDKASIKEIDHAPRDVLSLQAAAKTLLQPEYSMHRFNWFEERGKDGTPLVRTLRSLLRNDLPLILPKTRPINAEIIDRMLSTPGKQPHISKIARACVARMNARAFFGEEFATNKEFMAAAEDFIDKTILIAESARLFPGFLGRGLASILEVHFSAQHKVFNALVPVAQQRIDEQEMQRSGQVADIPEHRDCMQWIMEQSSRLRPWTCELTKPWTAERIVHELMALWFGAVHAMAMATVFAVRDLSMNPEYVEPLRKEIESGAYEAWEKTGNGLPLLDSFLKESARLNPLDNVSTRRKVLKPFELSNGLRVQDGDWIATPLDAMNRDAKNWVDPLSFYGFRHLDAATLALLEAGQFPSPEPEKAAPLTDTRGWQTWGTGRMACPGRFYAAAGIKQIVSLILTKYDCEIIDREAPRKFSWRTCNVPRSDLPIVLRPRSTKPE